MASAVYGKVGKRGTLVIPASLRRRLGMTEGSMFIAEATDQGILIRPLSAVSIELYSLKRKAELLLSSAVDEEDYLQARVEVEKLGLDPDTVEHSRPRHTQ